MVINSCQLALGQNAGFNSTFIVLSLNGGSNTYFDLNAATANTDFHGSNLGTFAAGSSGMVFKGAEHNVWKCNGADITSTRIYYRIYQTSAGPSGLFISNNITYTSATNNGCSGQDQKWEKLDYSTNLLAGLSEGNYSIQVYSDASTTVGDRFASNLDNNYTATFTISDYGSFASAIYMQTCSNNNLSNSFYATSGDISTNGFTGRNFGTFFRNSGQLKIQGGEIKTWRSFDANVCQPNLNYRIYQTSTTPPTAFNVITLPFYEQCLGTAFASGDPCTNNRDQKWQLPGSVNPNPLANVDLTTFAPGTYNLEIYFDIPGNRLGTGCLNTTYINNNGTNYIATFTVVDQVTASNTGPYCVGQTIQLNGNSSTSPSWTGPVSFSNSTQNPTRSTATEAMSGEYIFTSTLANGCSQSASTFVTVSSSAVAGSNSPVCVGSTLNLTSSAGSSYSWSGPNSFTSSVQNPTVSASATAAMSGTYTVSIVGACGATGGVVDNFSDANYTANPTWTVQAGNWEVSFGELSGGTYTIGGVAASDNDRITTPSAQAYGSWEYQFKFDLTTHGQTSAVRFFIVSSGTNLINTNGYYVYADAAGNLKLIKRTGATPADVISTTYMANTSWRSIKVIRNLNGLFTLYLNGTIVGTGTDNTYTSSTILGIWTTGYDNGDNPLIDNISCSPAAIATTTVVVNSTPTTSNAGSNQTICQGTSATLAANNPTSGTGVWSITSGPNISAAQFANTAVYNTTFTPTATGTYVLTWTISNSPCTPSSSNVTITSIANTPCACLSYPLNYANQAADNDITNVTIGTLNNSSVCGANPGLNSVPYKYSNYTNSVSSTTLTQGATVNFSLTSDICGGTDNQNFFLIYIDFNQNGSFAEANEKVFSQIASGPTPSVSSGQTITGTFVVPATALSGTTRMRIVNTTGNFNSTNYAETNYSLGETEDYCVTIIPCTLPTINTQPLGFTECFNGTQSLSIAASGSSLTYQWYSNTSASTTGGTSLGSANGAQTATYTPTSSSAGTTYYYCVVTESNACSTTSNVVTVTVLPQLNAGSVSGITSGSGPNHLVIYQVYGAGGNSGAAYKRDFVVIYNPTASAVNLSGWSLQYAATAGNFGSNATNLSGTIQAGGYFLVQMILSGTNGSAIPTPDFTVSSNVDMAAANGKIALVSSTTALSGSCPTGGSIVDFVGFGTANCYEGSGATPAPSATNWITRALNGCQDTDVNSADFTAGNSTTPRNSLSPTYSCITTTYSETICAGQNASSMTVSGVSGGNGTYSYQWYSQAGNVACPTGSSITGWTPITNANSATYTPTAVTSQTTYACFVTSSVPNNCGGAWASNCRVVNVNPAPIINNMSTSVCSGQAFSATPVNLTNGTVPTGTTYSWTVPSVAGISGAASGTNASSISGTLTNSTSSPIDITYTVTPTTGTCTGATFTLTVTVNPNAAVNNMNTSTCTSVSITLTPINGTNGNIPAGTTFSWSAPVQTGVSGGSSGSGTSLTANLTGNGTAVYTLTPTLGSCPGVNFTVSVTVEPCSSFQSCNLVVYRVGDGTTTLTSSSTNAFPVAIQEISPTGQPVQTISGLFTGSNLLTQSGNATSVGMLNSYNGFLAIPGYSVSAGTALNTTAPASPELINKVNSILNGNGVLQSYTSLPTTAPIPFSGNHIRSTLATGFNTFYATGTGGNEGLYYYDGNGFSTQLINANLRVVEAFNNQLYVSNSANIYPIGIPANISSSTLPSGLLPPYPSGTASIYGFSISPDGCSMYVADNGNNDSYRGVCKYKLENGTWTLKYNYQTFGISLVVDYSGANDVIYVTTATNGSNTPNKIEKLIDDPINSTLTVVTTGWPIIAPSNYRFAGIDFTPNSTSVTISNVNNVNSQSFNVCQNGNAQTLTVAAATSSNSLSYQWYSNTTNELCGATAITGATNATYSPPTTPAGTTYYFVKISSNCATVTYSSIATVVVNPKPTPTITGNTPLCAGSNITLTANPAELSYSWTPNGQTTQSISVNATGTYGITVTDANSCTGSISTTVSGATLPSIISISPP